jgi:hypothetical protein
VEQAKQAGEARAKYQLAIAMLGTRSPIDSCAAGGRDHLPIFAYTNLVGLKNSA